MRLTILNLQGLFQWERRQPLIAEHLRSVAPDVVLLQEVVYLPDVSPWTNADLLNRELGYAVRISAVTRLQRAGDGSPYREGLTVLSRHPVVASESLALLHEADDPHYRIIQFVDVAAPDGLWRLGNVHMSVRDSYAITQTKEVLALLRARDEQRVLGGDFNVNHLERLASLWRVDGGTISTGIERYDSHPGTDETDDYVLAPAGVRMSDVQLSDGRLSDHRAVTVDLARD